MQSLEARRLAHRWRIVAGSLVLALVYVLFGAAPAYATTWPGPDDGSGNYAHCRLAIFDNGSTNVVTSFSCQYTLGTAGAATTNILQNNTGGYAIDFGTLTCTGCATFSNPGVSRFGLPFSGGTATNTAGHAQRDGTVLSQTDSNITSASYASGACSIWFSSAGASGIPSAAGPSSAGVPCVVDSVALNSHTVPAYPTNNYPGAAAGPAFDSTASTTCSRTLTDTTAMTGSFTATNTSANVTVGSPSWAWGDATTAGTTLTQNHTYGALSTMPTGGWTATLTQTFTSTSGHLFADGTSSKVVTCSLRVDFLHPDKSAVGSSDTSSTGDSGLDACLPSGWSTLNPLAWVGSLGCVLKDLFIPSSSTITALGHTWDTATTKLPFSVVNDVVTYIPQQLDDFRYAVSLPPSSAAFFCQGTWGNYFCSGHTTPFYGTDFGGGSGGHTVPAAVTVARDTMLFLIILVFVYSCWRGAGEILK